MMRCHGTERPLLLLPWCLCASEETPSSESIALLSRGRAGSEEARGLMSEEDPANSDHH